MRIGILGGGQLSRMLALAGFPLGIDFTFFEPTQPCCAENLGELIHANYQDKDALLKFANSVDVITYENENIPTQTLEFLLQHKPVMPGLEALKVSQDRLFEKKLFEELNIATARFVEINSLEDLKKAVELLGYPVFLKKRREGYDGKGQVRINNVSELHHFDRLDLCQNAILEQGVPFDREVSLVAVRNASNEIKFYDLNENIHEHGILIQTQNKPE